MTVPTVAQVTEALGTVLDPEIGRPITELNMVRSVDVAADGRVTVEVLLTVAGCPMRQTITSRVDAAVARVVGVTGVDVQLGVMSTEQRQGLQTQLRGAAGIRENPFVKPGSPTKVYAVASGKGGVGKSSVTVNLAAAMAAQGYAVGLLDADVYGHSVPTLLGVPDARPTQVEKMIMPVPAYDMKVISTGMFKPRRDQVVAWRGPMLDKMLSQLLGDVYWGDLDVLLLDLPPGTGDMAISVGQQLSTAEVVVVTTPQEAAAEVAERSGTMASIIHQRVAGVVENMSWLPCPHCGPSHRIEVFGHGGGARVARTLTERLGYEIPLLADVPLDPLMRSAEDAGHPVVLRSPESPAAQALSAVAARLAERARDVADQPVALAPVGAGAH